MYCRGRKSSLKTQKDFAVRETSTCRLGNACWNQAERLTLEAGSTICNSVLTAASALKGEVPGKAGDAAGGCLLSGSTVSPQRQSQGIRREKELQKTWIAHQCFLLPTSSSGMEFCPWAVPPTQGTSLKSQQKVTVSPPAWFPQGVKQYAANTDYFHLLGLQGQQAWCFIYKPMCRGEPRA